MPETCKTCRWWDVYKQETEADPGEGHCRRFPPTYIGSGGGISMIDFCFPIVLNDDRCGEHQPRPTEPQNITTTPGV